MPSPHQPPGYAARAVVILFASRPGFLGPSASMILAWLGPKTSSEASFALVEGSRRGGKRLARAESAGGHRRGEPDGGSHPREIGTVDGDAVRRGGTARRGGLEAPALALGQRGFIIIGALLADDPDDATAASGRADARGEREAGRG